MERRGFLKGLLVGTVAASSTALVQLASAADLKLLEEKHETVIGQPHQFTDCAVDIESTIDGTKFGEFVFVRSGNEYRPIGVLTSVSVSRTTYDYDVEGRIELMPGLRRGTVTFTQRYATRGNR